MALGRRTLCELRAGRVDEVTFTGVVRTRTADARCSVCHQLDTAPTFDEYLHPTRLESHVRDSYELDEPPASRAYLADAAHCQRRVAHRLEAAGVRPDGRTQLLASMKLCSKLSVSQMPALSESERLWLSARNGQQNSSCALPKSSSPPACGCYTRALRDATHPTR